VTANEPALDATTPARRRATLGLLENMKVLPPRDAAGMAMRCPSSAATGNFSAIAAAVPVPQILAENSHSV